MPLRSRAGAGRRRRACSRYPWYHSRRCSHDPPKRTGSERAEGKPISAKFENADGDIRPSIYNSTTDGFVETVLNPKTGAVISSETMTDADDLTHANAQKAAMAKASMSLQAATEKAIVENAGSQAVSVTPELRNGEAIAAVKRLRMKGYTTVREGLN
jgi:hypothetical protein